MISRHTTIITLGVVMAIALAFPALAADADWSAPVNEGVSALTKMIVGVAGGIIGLCIVGYGIYGAAQQRIELKALMVYFGAGLLVTIGPLAIIWWIEKLQKAS